MDMRELREKKGLTQKQVAKELGVDQSTVSLWEQGVCYPRVGNLRKLAKLYGVSVDRLLK